MHRFSAWWNAQYNAVLKKQETFRSLTRWNAGSRAARLQTCHRDTSERVCDSTAHTKHTKLRANTDLFDQVKI